MVTDGGTVTARLRDHGHPPAARPGQPVLRRERPAHAPGNRCPDRSREGAGRHVHQRRNSAPLRAHPPGRQWRHVPDRHRSSVKHGHVDEEREAFGEIERFAAQHFGAEAADYRWTNEDYTPVDGAPAVAGWSSSMGQGYLVATGFDAWGITNGTVAGVILAALAEGREHQYGQACSMPRGSSRSPAQGVRAATIWRWPRTWSARIYARQATFAGRACPRRRRHPQDRRRECRGVPR